MSNRTLHSKAWVSLTLQTLYFAAESLCSIFVGVYLWINSLDFHVVCMHYLALYAVTPIFFLLSGWYATTHERLHVYRFGLLLHAVYYGALLILRERAVDYAVYLGAFLGVTWGVFYSAANTFNFDVTVKGRREYYLGLLHSLIGLSRMVAPVGGALLIALAPDKLAGYHLIFAVVIGVYLLCALLSFKMPPDKEPRPFKIRRALFPRKDQRDWRLIMLASASLAGAFSIFTFLLGLLMYIETGDEIAVGGFASMQGLVGVITAFMLARLVVPKNRKRYLFIGMCILVTAGLMVSFKLTLYTLILFGFFRSIAGPFFAVSHFSLRLDIISECVDEPAQRIEYLCAWEVPLAIGRIFMMLALMALYDAFDDPSTGLQLALLLLCSTRIATYLLVRRTSMIRRFDHVKQVSAKPVA